MQKESLQKRYLIAYDVDCGPCTKFKRIVDRLDIYHKIDFISLSSADQDGLLDTISPSLRYKSFHLISPAGQVESAAEALLKLIRILPGGKIVSPLIKNVPGARWFVRFVYTRFSKLHDRGSCPVKFK